MWLLVDCIFFPLTSAQLVADFNSLFCIDFILKYIGKGTKHISLKIMLKKKNYPVWSETVSPESGSGIGENTTLFQIWPIAYSFFHVKGDEHPGLVGRLLIGFSLLAAWVPRKQQLMLASLLLPFVLLCPCQSVFMPNHKEQLWANRLCRSYHERAGQLIYGGSLPHTHLTYFV